MEKRLNECGSGSSSGGGGNGDSGSFLTSSIEIRNVLCRLNNYDVIDVVDNFLAISVMTSYFVLFRCVYLRMPFYGMVWCCAFMLGF